jgi:hypothetical protein
MKTNFLSSKGSVVVEFQVVFEERTKDPLEPLRTHAQGNKFGNFNVDPNSIKEKSKYILVHLILPS